MCKYVICNIILSCILGYLLAKALNMVYFFKGNSIYIVVLNCDDMSKPYQRSHCINKILNILIQSYKIEKIHFTLEYFVQKDVTIVKRASIPFLQLFLYTYTLKAIDVHTTIHKFRIQCRFQLVFGSVKSCI